MTDQVLCVQDLAVDFVIEGRRVKVVEGVSFQIAAGEIVGLVGESGSGKSVTGLAVMNLLTGTGRVPTGSVRFRGTDLTGLTDAEMAKRRGRDLSMVFQDPMTSLNPGFRVGRQIEWVVRRHSGAAREQARARVTEVLGQVGLPDPEAVARSYPHQLSGGMRQRALIGLALACEPELVILDEPTTALDVITQDGILRLFSRLRDELGVAMLLTTHDMGVVADVCDRAMVMYAGQIVESNEVLPLFAEPIHPYTSSLMACIPKIGSTRLSAPPGLVPKPTEFPDHCRFADRCPHMTPESCMRPTELREVKGGAVRCARAEELHLGGVRT